MRRVVFVILFTSRTTTVCGPFINETSHDWICSGSDKRGVRSELPAQQLASLRGPKSLDTTCTTLGGQPASLNP